MAKLYWSLLVTIKEIIKNLKEKSKKKDLRKKKFEWGEQDIVIIKKPDQKKDKDASN